MVTWFMPEVTGSRPKHVKPSDISSWTVFNNPSIFQRRFSSSHALLSFFNNTFIDELCPICAFSSNLGPQPYPPHLTDYRIGISSKWPQTRELSSNIINMAFSWYFKRGTFRIDGVLSHVCTTTASWRPRLPALDGTTLPNWYTSTTCIAICKDVSILG